MKLKSKMKINGKNHKWSTGTVRVLLDGYNDKDFVCHFPYFKRLKKKAQEPMSLSLDYEI